MMFAMKALPGWMAVALSAVAMSAPVSAADIGKGREIFMNYCAGCHGANGAGLMPGTPNFTRGMVLMAPDAVLVESIRAGRNAMPGFRGVVIDQQLLDVVAFLRTLQ